MPLYLQSGLVWHLARTHQDRHLLSCSGMSCLNWTRLFHILGLGLMQGGKAGKFYLPYKNAAGIFLHHRWHTSCFVLIFMISLKHQGEKSKVCGFPLFCFFCLWRILVLLFFSACLNWQSWLHCVPGAMVPPVLASQAWWEQVGKQGRCHRILLVAQVTGYVAGCLKGVYWSLLFPSLHAHLHSPYST